MHYIALTLSNKFVDTAVWSSLGIAPALAYVTLAFSDMQDTMDCVQGRHPVLGSLTAISYGRQSVCQSIASFPATYG